MLGQVAISLAHMPDSVRNITLPLNEHKYDPEIQPYVGGMLLKLLLRIPISIGCTDILWSYLAPKPEEIPADIR